ncbi:MAG TPA: hypothetical protein VI643_01770, partial [Planctomycetota bacterium]|nr:hypothetical protein [Planctomycetota bacterium]
DTSDFPAGPDVFLKIPGGTLQSVAQSMGTYFTSQAQLDAYRTANGGNLPGGKVYYLDFSVCQPMDFGATMNSAPSILVHHTSAGNAKMKNVHGQFKGLLMVDGMEHINADTTILGAIVSFTPFTVGNAYGNGGATIRFSSAVLGGLPPMMLSGGAWPIISWREISAN